MGKRAHSGPQDHPKRPAATPESIEGALREYGFSAAEVRALPRIYDTQGGTEALIRFEVRELQKHEDELQEILDHEISLHDRLHEAMEWKVPSRVQLDLDEKGYQRGVKAKGRTPEKCPGLDRCLRGGVLAYRPQRHDQVHQRDQVRLLRAHARFCQEMTRYIDLRAAEVSSPLEGSLNRSWINDHLESKGAIIELLHNTLGFDHRSIAVFVMTRLNLKQDAAAIERFTASSAQALFDYQKR